MLTTPKRGLQKPELADGPAALRTAISGNADTLDGALGSRGKSIIATAEARTNVAYGLLTTPDQVSGIVLPTDGLIVIAYQATWQESVAGAGRAAVFLGTNQLKRAVAGGGPVVQEATGASAAANVDHLLFCSAAGLVGTGGAGAYTGDATTGQIVGGYSDAMSAFLGSVANDFAAGGPMYVMASAGTYDVSVRFKSSSGSVTAKNRKLWVWVETF